MPVTDTEENAKNCICTRCPSYPGENTLFCARGKSTKPVNRTECICVDCTIWSQQIRLACYFCSYGSAV